MILEVKTYCPVCKHKNILEVDSEALREYMSCKKTAEEAFPTLPVNKRMQLTSGFCDDCQERYFNKFIKRYE